MISDEVIKRRYYQALVDRNSKYDGIFFAGITSTGVFCHATCPARKPKFENCIFYESAEEALLSGFRPCKRCHPLSYPKGISPLVHNMVKLVEENPEKKWRDSDFTILGVHAATARRQFKKTYGMTFVQYARARRMGIALKSIKSGGKIINAQLDVGYESASGFHDAFSRIMGRTPAKSKKIKLLYASWIDTNLGPMISIVDEDYLYLLEFVDRRGLEKEVETMRNRLNASIVPGETKVSKQIEDELKRYFTKELKQFNTPIMFLGSPFQKSVWNELLKLEIGKTTSYKDLATGLMKPKSSRSIGNANGANQLSIIVPCHRVIKSDGSLGGYGGGIERKHWLINHESNYFA